jgi:L-aspartate oxidase
MEYSQIFIVTIHPTLNLLHGNWCWWQYPRILNEAGDEFLSKYLPSECTMKQCLDERGMHNPFTTRDRCSRYLDIAIIKENVAGRGTPHHGCYVDGLNIEKIPAVQQEWLSYRGIDLKARLEVSPAYQCCDGGLYIRENGQTNVNGLYAVGEVSAGMHGADRLGGHMMVNSQVFGMRAGEHAAARAKDTSLPRVAEETIEPALKNIETLRGLKGTLEPSREIEGLQRICWDNMLALRNNESLEYTIREIQRITAESLPHLSVQNSMQLTKALELQNLLLVGEMVCKAALARTESRGGHCREDFPDRDDANWLKSIKIRKIDDQMQLETYVIDPKWKDLPGDLPVGWVWG